MRWIVRAFTIAATVALGACAATPPPVHAGNPPAEAASEARAPVTILISIDGFRPDYLDRGVTPNLNALTGAGISASMRPSYPSKTFPNHWTLVTGLRPDRTGIVADDLGERGAIVRWCLDGETGLQLKQPLSFHEFARWRTRSLHPHSLN